MKDEDKKKEQLVSELNELRRRIIELEEAETKRARAEEALQQSEDRYKTLVKTAPDAVTTTDLEGNITEVSQRTLELHGCENVEEMLGKNSFELFAPEDYEKAMSNLRRTLEEGFVRGVQYNLVRKDGTRFIGELNASLIRDADGKPQAFIATTRDVTERVKAEESLQQYTERLRILREIDQAILAAQSPETIAQAALSRVRGLVPYYRACVALFDFETNAATVFAVYINGETSVGEGLSVPLEDFGVDEQLRRGEVNVVEDTLNQSHLSPLERALQAEGVRSYAKAPLVVRGELIGALNLGAERAGAFSEEEIEIVREVADTLAIAIQQARLHEQVQRHADELEQRVAERTAELDSFTYSVSHDLRAPLRAMRMFAEALLKDYGDKLDSGGQEYAQHIIKAAEEMGVLIRDLLAYSRLTTAEMRLTPLSLEQVVDEALSQLETEIKGKDAQITIEKPLLEVIANRTILVQVVANLLSNAVKFVAEGVQPKVRMWTEGRDNYVRLWIEDNGIGIAEEQRDRIFDVFERLHGVETYPGTGIGLAIVRKGVQRMGGGVDVESSPGQGSRFWVELPKADEG